MPVPGNLIRFAIFFDMSIFTDTVQLVEKAVYNTTAIMKDTFDPRN